MTALTTPVKGNRQHLGRDSKFRMPAEWEPHEATWLGWPHELTDWPGKFAPIPWAFAEIVRHLTRVERVNLLVEDRAAESRVRAILKKSGARSRRSRFFMCPPIADGCAIRADWCAVDRWRQERGVGFWV